MKLRSFIGKRLGRRRVRPPPERVRLLNVRRITNLIAPQSWCITSVAASCRSAIGSVASRIEADATDIGLPRTTKPGDAAENKVVASCGLHESHYVLKFAFVPAENAEGIVQWLQFVLQFYFTDNS